MDSTSSFINEHNNIVNQQQQVPVNDVSLTGVLVRRSHTTSSTCLGTDIGFSHARGLVRITPSFLYGQVAYSKSAEQYEETSERVSGQSCGYKQQCCSCCQMLCSFLRGIEGLERECVGTSAPVTT